MTGRSDDDSDIVDALGVLVVCAVGFVAFGLLYVDLQREGREESAAARGGQRSTKRPASASLEVVTYNLFWWNVAQNNNWDALYRKVDSQSFELIGFQECDNVGQIINGVGRMRGRFDSYTPPGMLINPVAWDSEKFEQLDAGWRRIGSDRWGVRITSWAPRCPS